MCIRGLKASIGGAHTLLKGDKMKKQNYMQRFYTAPDRSIIPKVPKCNIIKEYELIQQKKSTLSRMDRDRVVSIYEQAKKKGKVK